MDGELKSSRQERIAELAEILDVPRSLPEDDVLDGILSRAREIVASGRRFMQAAETLRVASLAVARNLDQAEVLDTLLDYLNWIVPYDAATVFLIEADTLVATASRDFRKSGGASEHLFHSAALYEWASDVAEGRATRETEAFEDGEGPSPLREWLGVPLVGENDVLGVVVIQKTEPGSFDELHVRHVEAFAGQAAAAIRNAQLFRDLRNADEELVDSYDATILGWSAALELRDHNTEGHTVRVTQMTVELARAIGFSEADLVDIRRGALLHDIGKMGVPDGILLKPERLSDAEREVMNRHPQLAYDLLVNIPFLKNALAIPYAHHERWDGTGYPRGLKGEAIPLAARVFSVIDVWDALTHERPYHNPWSERDAIDYITRLSGVEFDPRVVEIFLSMEPHRDRFGAPPSPRRPVSR